MQVVMYELLEAWGHDGLITHVKKMQTDYKNRAAIVQEAAGSSVTHLRTSLVMTLNLRNTKHDV